MVDKKRKSKSESIKAVGKNRVAERYRLELPSLLWELGKAREHALPAETSDISRSGLFLRGSVSMRPGSMISFEVQLPPVGDQPGGRMVGQATIVRQEKSGTGRTGIGAVIHQCEVWPAKHLAVRRATTQRGLPGGQRGSLGGLPRGGLARFGDKSSVQPRSGKERRAAERRKLAVARSRKAAALKAERRGENRRSSATRRKG